MSGAPPDRVSSGRLRELLVEMIDCYSPSGKESEIVELLAGALDERGLPVERQPVEPGRDNLIVSPAGDADAELVLVGHVDTVAAYELDGYRCELDGGRAHGLGAADMKGGCAAIIEAYAALWHRRGGAAPVALALVVGEEEEGDGSARLVEDHAFPWALIGEPTGLRPCLRHYGYLEIELTAAGRRRHASLAGAGGNPVENVLGDAARVVQHLRERRPDFVYNLRDLMSSRSGFAVPEWAQVSFDIHLPPEAAIEDAVFEIEELLRPPDGAPARTEIGFHTVFGGYALPDKGRVLERIRSGFADARVPWEPHEFRSHSDANLLWRAGTRPVICGPGRLEKAHAPDESVDLEEVERAAKLYLAVGERF